MIWRRSAVVVLAATAFAWSVLAIGPAGPSLSSSSTGSCTAQFDSLPGEVEQSYSCSYGYATMPDGTQVAVAVSYPAGYSPTGSPTSLPALFMMDGYDGGGGALDPNSYGNDYVMVHASLPGTGCSSGRLDLFSWQDAEYGAYLVDNWIPAQPWSDGRVGIIGHSYPGLTGFMVAERVGYDATTQPGATSHLDGVAVSGLIDDLYRGLVYMGGVPDYGFPLLWAEVDRPASELQGNEGRMAGQTEAGDTQCLTDFVQHQVTDTLAPDNPVVEGLTEETDTAYWSEHSLVTYAQYLDAPIHMDQQFQDEQTGPRGGGELMQALEGLSPALPKRIVFSNGRHDSAGHVYHADEEAWLDCYVASGAVQAAGCAHLGVTTATAPTSFGAAQPSLTYPSAIDTAPPADTAVLLPTTTIPCPGSSVVTYFETIPATTGTSGALVSDGTKAPLCSSAFPLPATEWDGYYLNADGSMTATQGATGERSYLGTGAGPDEYVGPTEYTAVDTAAGNLYQDVVGPVLSTQAPHELAWELPFTAETTLDGPIIADVYASVAGATTDFFVQLVDLDESTGTEQYLQYGLLRATYVVTYDQALSDCIDASPCGTGPSGPVYRPYYTYAGERPPEPGHVEQYRIEVFPLAWVFRPGHALLVTISDPPAIDQLSAWAGAEFGPTLDTVYSTVQYPSSILLPLLPEADNPDVGPTAPPCSSGEGVAGAQEGIRCARPALGGPSS